MQDTQGVLNDLCFLALDSPWPSVERTGVRGKKSGGFDGPRAARVLCAVLQLASRVNSLSVIANLQEVAEAAGFAGYVAARDALWDLECAGWVTFEIGTQHRYADGVIEERGIPSKITLLPKASAGSYSLRQLPMMSLDPFSDDAAGSGGWFVAARLRFHYRDVEHIPHLRMVDIVNVTGLSRDRLKRLMPKMMSAGLCARDGSWYNLFPVELAAERDIFDDDKARRRAEKRFAKAIAKGEIVVDTEPVRHAPCEGSVCDPSQQRAIVVGAAPRQSALNSRGPSDELSPRSTEHFGDESKPAAEELSEVRRLPRRGRKQVQRSEEEIRRLVDEAMAKKKVPSLSNSSDSRVDAGDPSEWEFRPFDPDKVLDPTYATHWFGEE